MKENTFISTPNSLMLPRQTATFEPIKLGTRAAMVTENLDDGQYKCKLLAIDGTKIDGTEFEARELTLDDTVAVDTPILVVPCQGYWGFL